MDGFLFEKGPAKPESKRGVEGGGKPRLRTPFRGQVEMHYAALDDLLEEDHRARFVWSAVADLPLDRWLVEIKAVEGGVGRDATDPRLLLALWVLATLESIGSARELARLCTKHLAYLWLCGGVTVNYHLLADFRSQHGDKLDDLLTRLVASLLETGEVTMQRVAQDGMRVRASAGKSSFKRRTRLEGCLEEARQQVQELKRLAEESPQELSARKRAARERVARERVENLERALKQCEELQTQREATARKSGRTPQEPRTSITDPEARVMQFSDGGYRPGYNVQFSGDTATGIICGVEVVNIGSDLGQLPPMLGQLHDRYKRVPEEALVDGGFASLDAIDEAAKQNCTVYAPLKDATKQLEAGRDPYARKPGDSEAIAAWRARMGTERGKNTYKLRSQTAEWINALARNRGLRQMPVRGPTACRAVALVYAIAHNLAHLLHLRSRPRQVTS
jgi:transposase